MSFADVVQQHADVFTPADRELVRLILDDPTQAAFFSAAELAQQADVHPASVVRLAQKLGYSGFPAMRRALRGDVVAQARPSERIRRRLAHLAQDGALTNLVESEIEALRSLPTHVSQQQIDDAAAMIIAAERVFIFAYGNAISLADMLDRRLRRSGFRSVLLRHQGRDLAEHVVSLEPNDLILAFAFRARPRGYGPLLAHAQRLRAKSLVISDSLALVKRPRPTQALVAPRGPEQEYQTLTVPMAICNSLVLTIARLDEGRSMRRLDRLIELIADFETEPSE